jgi:hypothetical protein
VNDDKYLWEPGDLVVEDTDGPRPPGRMDGKALRPTVAHRAKDAVGGHHVPGTPYNWRHEWEPRNAETARRYGKPFNGTDHLTGQPKKPSRPDKTPAPRKIPGPGKAPGQADLKWSSAQSKAITDYTGGQYRDVNGALRRREQPDSSAQEIIERLDEVFAETPPLTGPITVRRNVGRPEAMFGEIGSKVDREFVDDGFVSTTSGETPTLFGHHELVITVPAGFKALDVKAVSDEPDEDEVLLPRGTVFRVLSDEVGTVEGRRNVRTVTLVVVE